MAVSSCWLLTLATVKLEERARSYSSIIYKSVEGPASLDLFGNGLNLERYHVNSAAVNYLALALSDDINSVKHIFKNKSEK